MGTATASGAGISAVAAASVTAPASAIARRGPMRLPTRSDHAPAATRAAAPPICTTASASAEAVSDQPRSSLR